jgi:hypothetical protein
MLTRAPGKPPTLRQRRAQSRRNAVMMVQDCRKQYEDGKVGALLRAIYWCAVSGTPIDKWAADTLQKKYRAAAWEFKHRSWDEVFGKPNPGQNFHAHKEAKRLSLKVYMRVWQLRAKRPKPHKIYKTVGDEFRISPRTARRYFEDFQKFYLS